MRLHNVRFGFACNSSSTHSMIFLPKRQDDHEVTGEFGWEFFTAASDEAKLGYLGSALMSTLEYTIGEDAARAIAEAWAGKLLSTEHNYIDHQSLPCFPREHGGKLVSRAYVEDYRRFIMQDGLVILGGNDNQGEDHPLEHHPDARPVGIRIPTVCGPNQVARKDGETWVLFDTETGRKIRFSFRDDVAPYKPATPELVDVKVTGYCPFACDFCYQDSTTAGRHTDADDLGTLAYTLGRMKVFEVALGGGEPTLHPKFAQVLRSFRHNDVVPNFTTRNLAWLRGPEAREILEYTGAFAFSIQSDKDVERLAAAVWEATGQAPHQSKAVVQVIEGVLSDYALEAVLRAADHHDLPVTILGFKEVGRGAGFQKASFQREQPDWLKVVMKLREEKVFPAVSIDTVLAARDAERIKAEGIPEYAFTTREGAYSMYIDTTTSRMGPSSFCSPEEMVEYDRSRNLEEQIRTAFARWPL